MIVAKPANKQESAVAQPTVEPVPVTKGHATPTRKEREAANLRPLVSSNRAVANKTNRAQQAQSRDRARAGMAAGEEKYLPQKDKGPQRRYVRDYVDARFSIGEVTIPFLGVYIVASFVLSTNSAFSQIALYAVYAFLIVLILDCVVLGFTLQRKLAAKFGADKVQRGFRWYAAMRAVQLRLMRLPKPQVKRGAFPV
jgi:hypothetical protein